MVPHSIKPVQVPRFTPEPHFGHTFLSMTTFQHIYTIEKRVTCSFNVYQTKIVNRIQRFQWVLLKIRSVTEAEKTSIYSQNLHRRGDHTQLTTTNGALA